MNKPRDTQKARLYRAERKAESEGGLQPSDIARRLMVDAPRVTSTGSVTIDACQQYVDHLTQSAWFQRRWGRRRFPVRHKAYGNATYSTGWTTWISLPPWARDEWTILHEVAHGLTDFSDCASHGPEFAGVFLALVEHRMGKDRGVALRAAYKAERVRHNMRRVPKPNDSRIREVPNPVRVPSKAVAAKHAAIRAERIERERAREAARVTPGFTLPTDSEESGNAWYLNWGSLARRIAQQAAGQLPENYPPLAGYGIETTKRGAKHCVQWTAEEREPGYWSVALTDRVGGKVRHHAMVVLPKVEAAA